MIKVRGRTIKVRGRVFNVRGRVFNVRSGLQHVHRVYVHLPAAGNLHGTEQLGGL